MPNPRIAHIVLSVSDWDVSQTFYDALMAAVGFTAEPASEHEGFAFKEYGSGDHSVMIQYEQNMEHGTFTRYPGLNHLALFVGSKEQVDQVHEVVRELHTTITREPREYPDYGEGYYAFYFRDPDGVPLEVCYYES